MYNFKKLKYKHYIKTSSKNINKLNELLAYNLSIKDDYVLFYTNDISQIDSTIEYEILLDRDSELKRIYKKYIGLVFAMTITIIALFFNSIRYNEIIFTERVNDKDSIIEYIEEKTSNILNMRYLNEDILEINVDIRNKFTNLEWISIDKIGTDIYVSTVRKNTINESISDDSVGNLVSDSNAIVRLVNVKKGRLLTMQNQYVNVGDKLVSSNLNEIYEGQKPYYVKASGIILGEYAKTVEYKIPITDKKSLPTGKIDSYISISILGFNINIGKDNNFAKYSRDEEEQFNFLGLIKFKKVQDIEKSDIILKNTKETSILLVEDIVYSEFEIDRVHELEEIISITLDSIVEEDGYFRVFVFIHQIKNIAIFSEIKPEESDD